jgi:hypothetical protein
MKFPFWMAAALVLGSTAVQAEAAVGGTSHGSSIGISRGTSSGMAGTATQQNFGALPGAPGSPSFNPNGGTSGSNLGTFGASRGIGTFGASPGAPGSPSFNPTTALPSPSAPNATIPSLDEVMPGASSSGLLGSSASGTNSSGSGAE